MSEIQEQIQRHIDTLVGTGAETGVQVAVYQDGALIVDAVAGTADPVTGRPLTSGTPIFSFSTGKNVSATLAHLLVARGFLDYDSPVTDLWPEFGVHGKATATLRHVLTHTVGLPAMPREITLGELPDWPRVCKSLAAAEPRWRPGTAMGYHSYTFGYLVGELARRATGRPMYELLREWITAPLGIEGQLYFAAPAQALPGLARLEQARQWWSTHVAARTWAARSRGGPTRRRDSQRYRCDSPWRRPAASAARRRPATHIPWTSREARSG